MRIGGRTRATFGTPSPPHSASSHERDCRHRPFLPNPLWDYGTPLFQTTLCSSLCPPLPRRRRPLARRRVVPPPDTLPPRAAPGGPARAPHTQHLLADSKTPRTPPTRHDTTPPVVWLSSHLAPQSRLTPGTPRGTTTLQRISDSAIVNRRAKWEISQSFWEISQV